MAERDPSDEAAEELYGLPPGDFTRARDERAKELRRDGERDAANAVKALRKPTVAAWALNQLSRRRKKDLDALLSAGEDLRAAQEELLAGGDRSGFQEAAAAERALVARLAADATTMATEAGERSGGLLEKVAATLHAAALDEDTAGELRAGRLVREREAIGGFGTMAETPGAAPPKRSSKAAPKSTGASRRAGASPPADSSPRADSSPPPRADSSARADSSPRPRARADSSARAAEEAQRRQRAAAARTDERHARRELEAAERAVLHAQERADAAEAHAREATERARITAQRLKDAKRAQAAARKAHTRAEKALAKAEDAAL